MEKLELKHLAPYLPYGLKIQCKRHFIKYGETHSLFMNGLNLQSDKAAQIEMLMPDDDLKFIKLNEKGFKPILRPLSDLTKEIEINGEKFRPTYRMTAETKSNYLLDSDCDIELDIEDVYGSIYINAIDIAEVRDKLIEWHFDVFGLIEKGLAVDINTLNTKTSVI